MSQRIGHVPPRAVHAASPLDVRHIASARCSCHPTIARDIEEPGRQVVIHQSFDGNPPPFLRRIESDDEPASMSDLRSNPPSPSGARHEPDRSPGPRTAPDGNGTNPERS